MIRAVLAAVCVATSAAGCGAAHHSPAEPTRTVVDMTGQHVQIPATVTRVATNIPLIPATIELLGGIDTVVAAARGSFNALFTTIAPATQQIPRSPPNSLNAEQLLDLHPQVFFMTDLTPGLLPMLQRLQIPVVQITAFTSPQDLQKAVNLVAQVLGGAAPARARQYDTYFDAVIQQVHAGAQTDRPTVYYAPGPDPTTTVGADNIITASIEAAGGRNIAVEHGIGGHQPGAFAFPTITAETLLAWNPDVIVASNARVADQLATDPTFATLNAVRDHHIYTCPVGIFPWCASSSEAALAPLFLAKKLHPERFSDLNLANKVANFYIQFYGYSLTGPQVTAILDGAG
ncbi:ABC transporter substrate-binding protein [Mycobacterium sherrisii]|uniref:ABC transporter substrate-binding protein n=1 Tax=Mycobacterium sherrisii TaxID=243061 RepID=UPI000A158D67|nr:ABC transporter substrate-binding protein [Mycobacterium sherrisii]MCV7031057.1 ABC transporter substrate-binding protein [Mycobacterium sherrisii]ORW83222.1 Fe3+-citrate ABC transporter substrate-binding protein [Mycobacterium sherrisii]